ncbi:MAG TPA: ABC-2 family transporter protein [Candidatus Sulfotelmatobacter sp.]|nr:ABC-2 family transporter protein [Candidatus Sulfotelmatobacter sp.]
MTLATAPLRQEPRWRAMLDFYLTMIRTAIQAQFQYRAATYMYLFGMVAEPVIYLVVWTTIARSHGGQVAGITAGGFAAYYIVWTLVRNMNIVFTPYGWEERIREGQLSGQLLRPLHPIHYDIADFAGLKVVWVLLYLPIAAGLILVFRPAFSVTPLAIPVFFLAIWGGYLIRTMNLWLLGMVTFWTTRGSAIFETYIMAELLLSGRLVPLQLMPAWAQAVSAWLPFKWTFFFPIEVLVGHLSTADLLGGIGMQILWTAIGAGLVWLVWRASVRHYSAVGN